MMSPIGKAVMLTIFVAILLAVYAGIVNGLTASGGALAGTEYAIVRTVLQYVPAIVAIGLMVIIWKGALKSD